MLLWFSKKNILQLFKKSGLVLCRIFFLHPDLFFSLMSAKIPRVFFSALLKSKYLAMYFSSWHPTASPPNYCGVSVSLADANQVCRKPALPSRQALTPGLAQQSGIVNDTDPLWVFWGWCSPFQNLRSYRRMISLTWNLQDIMLRHLWCFLLALASTKLNLLFVQGNQVLLFSA